jgi:hypothetical protein
MIQIRQKQSQNLTKTFFVEELGVKAAVRSYNLLF